jgi:hypothetical protein
VWQDGQECYKIVLFTAKSFRIEAVIDIPVFLRNPGIPSSPDEGNIQPRKGKGVVP